MEFVGAVLEIGFVGGAAKSGVPHLEQHLLLSVLP
jgi:hypothetical protein